MKRRFEMVFAAIGVAAVIFGLVLTLIQLWGFFFDNEFDIAKFEDPIALNAASNDNFIAFLAANSGKVIFVNSVIDASLALPEHYRIMEACNSEYYTADDASGFVLNRFISFPVKDPDVPSRHDSFSCYYTLYIDSTRQALDVSHGGTGLIQMSLVGFFLVTTRYFSGPSVNYLLTEQQADPNLLSKLLQK